MSLSCLRRDDKSLLQLSVGEIFYASFPATPMPSLQPDGGKPQGTFDSIKLRQAPGCVCVRWDHLEMNVNQEERKSERSVAQTVGSQR